MTEEIEDRLAEIVVQMHWKKKKKIQS